MHGPMNLVLKGWHLTLCPMSRTHNNCVWYTGVGSAALVDLNLYMSSLKTMLAVNPKRIYPGHGPVIMEGVAKLNEYILHR